MMHKQVTGHRSQVTGHRSQVTGHRSQVTGQRSLIALLMSIGIYIATGLGCANNNNIDNNATLTSGGSAPNQCGSVYMYTVTTCNNCSSKQEIYASNNFYTNSCWAYQSNWDTMPGHILAYTPDNSFVCTTSSPACGGMENALY